MGWLEPDWIPHGLSPPYTLEQPQTGKTLSDTLLWTPKANTRHIQASIDTARHLQTLLKHSSGVVNNFLRFIGRAKNKSVAIITFSLTLPFLLHLLVCCVSCRPWMGCPAFRETLWKLKKKNWLNVATDNKITVWGTMLRSDVCNSWCYCWGVTASSAASESAKNLTQKMRKLRHWFCNKTAKNNYFLELSCVVWSGVLELTQVDCLMSKYTHSLVNYTEWFRETHVKRNFEC